VTGDLKKGGRRVQVQNMEKIENEDSEEEEEEDDDDDSVEGEVCRSLFRTNSSSSFEDHNTITTTITASDENRSYMTEPNETSTYIHENHENEDCVIHVNTFANDIRIAEKKIGGSIETMLWPAAEYLANFILDFAKDKGIIRKEEGEIAIDVQNSCLGLENDKSTPCKEIREDVVEALEILITETSHSETLQIIELGAGVGLTSIMLATRLPCHVILTDLDDALPLLEQNIALNKEKYIISQDVVQARRLSWGTDDWKCCLDAMNKNISSLHEDREGTETRKRILLLASDCVYFQSLHAPLEHTIASILSAAPKGSICLIAGVRRWKRDNKFYSRIGKVSRSRTHELRCICLQETVTRADGGKREIMRVYAIQWVLRGMQTNMKI